MKLAALLLILLLGCSRCSQVPQGQYKVVNIPDGDTVVLLDEQNNQTRVRLADVDCPELHQDYGQRAKNYTTELLAGKMVALENRGKDKFDRVLGVLYLLPDSMNVNRKLVQAGMAWRYKYSKDEELLALQKQAKALGLGLWAQPNPVQPWAWRKDNKRH